MQNLCTVAHRSMLTRGAGYFTNTVVVTIFFISNKIYNNILFETLSIDL
jgi:hypothetical protein